MRSSLNTSCLLPQSTGILGASWHKQCLTPRKHKYWSTSRLRLQHMPDVLQLQQGVSFSPCRAHRLHLHLWWSTSRRHQQFMLHLRLSWCTSRWHKHCLTPRKHKYWSTSHLRLQHMPGRSANCNREFHSLPVVPTVYTCTYGGVHRAGNSSLCCTCACHGVHRAPRESIPYVLSSARSFVQETGQRSRYLRSVVNSVSLQDNCLVVLGACIWHLSCCVSTGKMVVPTSQLKSNVLLLFGCMFCLVALSGQFSRTLAHRLSLR